MTKAEPLRNLLLVFGTVQRVMRAEKAARAAGLDVDAVPAPRAVSSQCGVVLEARAEHAGALEDALHRANLTPLSVWRRRGDGWTPSALDAVVMTEAVKLTAGSAYGGCGAKLAKGLLASVLCGLPRLESEDLIVGIEYADDAGVPCQRGQSADGVDNLRGRRVMGDTGAIDNHGGCLSGQALRRNGNTWKRTATGTKGHRGLLGGAVLGEDRVLAVGYYLVSFWQVWSTGRSDQARAVDAIVVNYNAGESLRHCAVDAGSRFSFTMAATARAVALALSTSIR